MSIRRGYPCDLSDEQWALIEPTLTAWRRGRDARDPVGVRPEPTCAKYGTRSYT